MNHIPKAYITPLWFFFSSQCFSSKIHAATKIMILYSSREGGDREGKNTVAKRWEVCRTGSKAMLMDKWWKMKVFLLLSELLKDFWGPSSGWAAIRPGFILFCISEEYMFSQSPIHCSHFPFCRYRNKLHPHVEHTKHFKSVSEHVDCLQSHVNLNAHLKYLWKSCDKCWHDLTCVHRAVVGCIPEKCHIANTFSFVWAAATVLTTAIYDLQSRNT